MTLLDAAVGFIGLAVGYAVVSWWLDRGSRAGSGSARGRPAAAAPGEVPPDPRPPPRADEDLDEEWPRVLGVGAMAPEAEVRAAWRARLAQYHPDKVSGMGPEIVQVAERESARINAAWEAAQRAIRARAASRDS